MMQNHMLNPFDVHRVELHGIIKCNIKPKLLNLQIICTHFLSKYLLGMINFDKLLTTISLSYFHHNI